MKTIAIEALAEIFRGETQDGATNVKCSSLSRNQLERLVRAGIAIRSEVIGSARSYGAGCVARHVPSMVRYDRAERR
jgi:hypothetical protein